MRTNLAVRRTLTMRLARTLAACSGVLVVAGTAFTSLPCISNTIIDTSTYPATGLLVCLNDGCVIPCSEVQESTDYGIGTTCACYPGSIPRCCHLVLVAVGAQWAVVPQGHCSQQNGNCQSGSTCSLFSQIYDDVEESTPKCLGGT